MNEELQRLGRYVKARREALGRSQMDVWKKHGGPSSTKMGQIEDGRPPAPSAATQRKLERALIWQEGSVEAILTGGEPTPVEAWDPVPQEHIQERPINDADPVDRALSDFQRAASELVRAENEFDAQMRRWATGEAMREKVRIAAAEKAIRLGRELTQAEYLSIDDLPRPTAAEIAELQAWSAMHDAREWTRYEMALIEAIWTDYPHDVRAGSTYADLEPFRARVRRLATGDQTDAPLPGRVTPTYMWAGPPPEGGDGHAEADAGGSAPTNQSDYDLAADEGYDLSPEDEAEETERST